MSAAGLFLSGMPFVSVSNNAWIGEHLILWNPNQGPRSAFEAALGVTTEPAGDVAAPQKRNLGKGKRPLFQEKLPCFLSSKKIILIKTVYKQQNNLSLTENVLVNRFFSQILVRPYFLAQWWIILLNENLPMG